MVVVLTWAGVLTCRRANEHKRECASLALRDEGQAARRGVCGLHDVMQARSQVVHAVRLKLAQQHHLQSWGCGGGGGGLG